MSELAIIAAMMTSTHVRTDTSNIQTDETTADTEVNDESDDKTQGEEEEG